MMNNNNTTNNNYNNNNNNDNNDNTMSTYDDNSSSSIPVAEAVPSTPVQQKQHENSSALYKLAARNLREYHGVPSMTALKLEKTVALLGLRPRRLLAQGLAPRRLLKGNSSPLVSAGESSDEVQEELCEAVTGALMDASGENLINDNNINNSSSEGMLFSDDSNSTSDDNGDSIDHETIDNGGYTMGDVEGFQADKKKRPIHAALVAGGIDLRPRETRHLLRALAVSPHRLVKLGLVKREAVHAMPSRRGGGCGPGQHLRAGGPGKRGAGGPRGPPHGPPRLPFHGAGHQAMHRGEESEVAGVSTPLGPHGGPGHRGPRHHGGRLQGPPHGSGHHSKLTVGHGCGPPGGGKHGHGHRYSPHGFGPGHEHHAGGFHSEGEGEGGKRLHGGGAGGSRQHGPRRHGGGMCRPRAPPHGPPHPHRGPSSGGGQSGPMHCPTRRPFHGAGHHTKHWGEESEEEAMSLPLDAHEDTVWVYRSGGKHGHGHGHPPHGHGHGHGHHAGGFHSESGGERGERLHDGGARMPGKHGPRRLGGGMGGPRGPPHGPPHTHRCCGPPAGGGPSGPMHGPPRHPFHGPGNNTMYLGGESEEEGMSAPQRLDGDPGHRCPRHHGGGGRGRPHGRPEEQPHGPVHGPFHGLFHGEGGGGSMKKRDGRHGGVTGFSGGCCGGGGGGGGGGCDVHRRRRAHLSHFHGSYHQPQLEAY